MRSFTSRLTIVRIALSGLSMLVLGTAPSFTQEVEHGSLFGIELDKPLDLAPCPTAPTPDGIDHGQISLMCKAPSLSGVSGEAKVYLPGGKGLDWQKYDYFVVRYDDGGVTAIVVLTRGLRVQRDALAAATAKFGSPAKQEIVKLSNGAGAAFDEIQAHWEIGKDIITFNGGNADSGILEALSGRELARLEKEDAAKKANAPQL